MSDPKPPPERGPAVAAAIAMAVVALVLVGGYLLFPSLHRAMSYQDCIASGRVTGC